MHIATSFIHLIISIAFLLTCSFAVTWWIIGIGRAIRRSR